MSHRVEHAAPAGEATDALRPVSLQVDLAAHGRGRRPGKRTEGEAAGRGAELREEQRDARDAIVQAQSHGAWAPAAVLTERQGKPRSARLGLEGQPADPV